MSTISTRTEVVPIFQGDDWAEYQRLNRAVINAAEAAAAQGAKRLGDADELKEAAAEHDAFVAEAAERAVKVTVAARKRDKWRELVEAHPPRADHDNDRQWGFNFVTLADALVPESVVKVEGPDGPIHNVGDFLDDLNDADFSTIYSACVRLNQGDGPKGPISSRIGLTSA